GAVASHLLPRLPYTAEQRRDRNGETPRRAGGEDRRLVVSAMPQPPWMERNGHEHVRFRDQAGFEEDRQRGSEILPLLVLEAVDRVRERAAVQVRCCREREPRRVRAASRAAARPQRRKQRFVLRNSAQGAAGGSGDQRLCAEGAERRIAGLVAGRAARRKEEIERGQAEAL